MLLNSLLRQLRAEAGTPGTPEHKDGVPCSDTSKPAPVNNLVEAEHQEHREHQELDEVFRVWDRSATRRQLLRLYRILGESYTKEHWHRLISVPGWRDRLTDLEEAFTQAWKDGCDCWQEFEQLREHWRSGIKHISGAKVA